MTATKSGEMVKFDSLLPRLPPTVFEFCCFSVEICEKAIDSNPFARSLYSLLTPRHPANDAI